MIKYRLHNITDFSIEIHDLYTNKNIYVGFDGQSYANPSDGIKDYIETVSPNKPDTNNVSRETPHESEIDWIKRHTPTEEEKEPYTKLEKISSFLGILFVIIMATFLLYLFLSSVSFIAEYLSPFTWKLFNIL